LGRDQAGGQPGDQAAERIVLLSLAATQAPIGRPAAGMAERSRPAISPPRAVPGAGCGAAATQADGDRPV